MIDAYDCDKTLLGNLNHVKKFLQTIPTLIGMTIIIDPQAIDYKAENSTDDGITGFTIIAESHISIHTYPKRKFFAFDCFSCNEFDVEKILEYITNQFKVGYIVPQLAVRGFDSEIFNKDKIINLH